MCIDCDGHHSGGSSFVYVNDFCYYRNCLYTTGTSTTLRKNRSMRVPVYSIDSIAPQTSVRIRQSGRIGIRGLDSLVVSEPQLGASQLSEHPGSGSYSPIELDRRRGVTTLATFPRSTFLRWKVLSLFEFSFLLRDSMSYSKIKIMSFLS